MVTTLRCFKCKDGFGTIASRDGPSAPYCSDCFTEFVTKTVRDNLFTQSMLACDVPVALALSGGPHSLLLAHQVGVLRSQGALRMGSGRVNFLVLPFHLREDELVLPPPPDCGSGGNTGAVEKVRQQFAEHFTALEGLATRQPSTWQFASAPLYTEGEVTVFTYSDFLSADELEHMRRVIHHSKKSLTEREEIYDALKARVLSLAAKRVTRAYNNSDCASTTTTTSAWTHLLLGDGAVRCCVSALSAIVSGGGGSQMAHSSGPRGYVHQVVLQRPLRTLLEKEVIFYNHINGIAGSYTPSLSTGTTLRSIKSVLEGFVLSTSQSYRTSVFNILNIATKLQTQPQAAQDILKGTYSNSSSTDNKDSMTKQKKKVALGKTSQYYRDQLQQVVPPPAVVSSSSASSRATSSSSSQSAAMAVCLGCGGMLPYPMEEHSSSRDGALGDTDANGALIFLCYSCKTTFQAFGDSSDNAEASPLRVLLSMEERDWPMGARTVKAELSADDKAAFLLNDDDE